jgi:hypothetical protein
MVKYEYFLRTVLPKKCLWILTISVLCARLKFSKSKTKTYQKRQNITLFATLKVARAVSQAKG